MITVDINPAIIKLGTFEIRWYGLMYVLGFLIAGQIFKKLCRSGFMRFPEKEVDNYITYLLIGMLIGARFAFVFIYNWDSYSSNPMDIFAVWKGGLSFHGAVVGLVAATYLFARKHGAPFFSISDSLALAAGPGLFLGRMGNFINGELWGRVTDVPWAMIFPEGGPFPRHPSQLYEGILEGIILGLILWLIKSKVKIHGIISASFILGYGVFRFCIEYFREPDSQLGYFFSLGWTMGQILCLIMVLVSGVIFYCAKKQNIKISM